jgi:hypothetical protein
MYIHIGEDINIRLKDIIAMVDKQSGESSNLFKEFLKLHKGIEKNDSKQSFKSIVITSDHVYFSPYSTSTLKKRSNFMNIQE